MPISSKYRPGAIMMTFQNDYHHMLDVLANRRLSRLPIYEHHIGPEIMGRILGVQFAGLINGNEKDLDEFFCRYYIAVFSGDDLRHCFI
jgi:hypothetical protein